MDHLTEEFVPSKQELRDTLSPWVIRQNDVGSFRWRYIRATKFASYQAKKAARHASSSILPWVRSRAKYRTTEFVDTHYSQTWSRYNWPNPDEVPSRGNTVYLEWDNFGYEALRSGLVRLHLLGIAKFIRSTTPRKVLEIGAGPGINLLVLGACFPEIEFTGVELTADGVAMAKSAQNDRLPAGIRSFAPVEIKDLSAHKSVDFNQCDATRLPFADNAFDLVFSRLAIEQMEQVRDQALAEIRRVSKHFALFVEPFADFNDEPLMRLATTTKNYISLSCSDLPQYGFDLQATFSDWPQKITNGAGLVVCTTN
ncbi:MAG: class I SAM-dependent methyltransferase [Rhizobiaceae bacterium]